MCAICNHLGGARVAACEASEACVHARVQPTPSSAKLSQAKLSQAKSGQAKSRRAKASRAEPRELFVNVCVCVHVPCSSGKKESYVNVCVCVHVPCSSGKKESYVNVCVCVHVPCSSGKKESHVNVCVCVHVPCSSGKKESRMVVLRMDLASSSDLHCHTRVTCSRMTLQKVRTLKGERQT